VSDLERGALVQHSTLGLGKVVALESDAVHVFFPGRGERFAAKLRLPGARAFLRTGLEERDAWLEGLSSFTLDASSGRWALPARWLTLDQVVAQFLDAQPKGFAPGIPGRAATWRAAHEAFVAAVGNGEAERLLEAEDERELVRRLLKVAKLVSPLHAEEDRDAIEDSLGDDEQTARFLWALFELLSVPSPGRARFDKLFSAASGLPGAPGSRWLVVTLFPFLGRPDRHPIMHPGSTVEAAERLGFELKFDDTPNWSTLSALRAHSERMLKSLAPSGAKDYVDVEVFFHAASKMRASGAKRVAKRAAKAAAKMLAAPPAAVAKAAASPAPKAAPAAKAAAPKGAPKKVAAKPVAKAIAKPAKKPAPKAAKKPAAKKAAAPAKKVAKAAGRRSAA
jgi:hypothetical protein